MKLEELLSKALTLSEEIAEFDEKEFYREWSVRGVGMAMPENAMHGARCYHQWFVRRHDAFARSALPLLAQVCAILTQDMNSIKNIDQEKCRNLAEASLAEVAELIEGAGL